MDRKKLIILNLSGCKGCQNQLFSLPKNSDYQYLLKYFDIFFFNNNVKNQSFDIALINGSAKTKRDILLLKDIKKQSKIIIALGSCACSGGIKNLANDNTKKLTNYVYGRKYQTKITTNKPIDYYITVDYHLSGCPINIESLKQLLANLAHDKILEETTDNICLNCKINNNNCFLLQEKPCLGPITKDNCHSLCPSNGVSCKGCAGPTASANLQAIITTFKKQGKTKKEIKQILYPFFGHTKDYKKIFPKPIKIIIKI